MIRRTAAVLSLAAVVGGVVATAAPAHASDNSGYICIGTTDRRYPGMADGLCLDGVRIGG
jgi:hypothetical protein